MLKFLFNRFSFMVKLMEVTGAALLPFLFYKIFFVTKTPVSAIVFAAVIAIYAFIHFSAAKRWHPEAPRYSGIELHFVKALVPTGYILTIFGILSLAFNPTPYLIAEAILLVIIAHVNVILLYLHYKDNDPTPVDLFGKR